MASLRAQLMNAYLKWKVKSKPLHLIDADILRANMDAYAPKRIPKWISIEPVDEDGVKGEWHRSANAEPGRTILYLHGGGYVFGSAKSHRNLTFALARASAANVFSLDYRLAPEHPFPAAVEDAFAVWRRLISEGRDRARTIVAGDSAGGGLALALMIACKDEGLALPAGAVLYSPLTDLAVTGASIEKNAKSEAMFMPGCIAGGVHRYLAGADPRTPLASPLHADLVGLPPVLIFASADEALLDDSTRLHEKLLQAGGASTLVVEKGLMHIWPIYAGRIPEAMRTIRRSAAFIAQRLETEKDA